MGCDAKKEISYDFPFCFKFRLHKAYCHFIGIIDSDNDRLRDVYGVDQDTYDAVIKAEEEHNAKYAEILKKKVDLSKLGERPLKIAFLGDSITSDRNSYLNIIKKAVEDMDVEFFDFSVSGATTASMFAVARPDYTDVHADIAHIMIGTNDIRSIDDEIGYAITSATEFEKNVGYIVRELTKEGTKVIISTIPPIVLERAKAHFTASKMIVREEDRVAYNAILEKIADKYGAVFNKMDEHYGKYPMEELTFADGHHLNEIGQEILTEQVAKRIVEVASK